MGTGRYYKLSKKMTEEQREEVLREMRAIEALEQVEIDLDAGQMLVKTAKDRYPEVMGKAVNICRRVANGTELSFAGFAWE